MLDCPARRPRPQSGRSRHLVARPRTTSCCVRGTDRRRKDSSPAEFPRRDISHNKKFVVGRAKSFWRYAFFVFPPAARCWSLATSSPRPGFGGPSTARSKECCTSRSRELSPSRHRAFDPACPCLRPRVSCRRTPVCAFLTGGRPDGRRARVAML